jgi:hypothetical protein
VVYQEDRHVLALGGPGQVSALSVGPPSGRDINGDGLLDLVVTDWSGGIHCCYTTTVYAVAETPREILSAATGSCQGTLEDLDGNGTLEFSTCDDSWSDQYCAFAFAPFPPVVYAFDPGTRRYVMATPRFASQLRDQIAALVADAQKSLADPLRDVMLDKCVALGPVLALAYTGRIDEGLVLLRALYRGADRDAFEREIVEQVRKSPLWAPQ